MKFSTITKKVTALLTISLLVFSGALVPRANAFLGFGSHPVLLADDYTLQDNGDGTGTWAPDPSSDPNNYTDFSNTVTQDGLTGSGGGVDASGNYSWESFLPNQDVVGNAGGTDGTTNLGAGTDNNLPAYNTNYSDFNNYSNGNTSVTDYQNSIGNPLNGSTVGNGYGFGTGMYDNSTGAASNGGSSDNNLPFGSAPSLGNFDTNTNLTVPSYNIGNGSGGTDSSGLQNINIQPIDTSGLTVQPITGLDTGGFGSGGSTYGGSTYGGSTGGYTYVSPGGGSQSILSTLGNSFAQGLGTAFGVGIGAAITGTPTYYGSYQGTPIFSTTGTNGSVQYYGGTQTSGGLQLTGLSGLPTGTIVGGGGTVQVVPSGIGGYGGYGNTNVIGGSSYTGGSTASLSSLGSEILSIIDNILVPLLFAIAFIVFLYGVFKYFIQKADNAEAHSQGWQFVMYGLIGFFIMISIWGLVNLATNTIGLDNQTHPNYPTL